MQYYLLRSSDSSSGSSSGGSAAVSAGASVSGGGSGVIDSLNYGEFKTALAVLTFDRVLHLVNCDADRLTAAAAPTAATDGSAAVSAAPDDVSALADSLAVNFDKSQLVLSINVKPCTVTPVYLPRDGYRDSFEIVIPKRSAGLTSSLTSLITSGSQLKNICSVLIVFEDSVNVRNWMRCLSNPFVDPNIDSPSDYDCEENEYISMSNTYSSNKGDDVF